MKQMLILLPLLAALFTSYAQVTNVNVGVTDVAVGIFVPASPTSITVDSFLIIDHTDSPPVFQVSLDSLVTSIAYPQMERDNHIGGNSWAFFRVNSEGRVDSVWLNNKVSAGIDKAIFRFLKSLPPFTPATTSGRKVSAICRLSFHFKVMKQ